MGNRIGALRQRITFQALSYVDDGLGGQTQTWTEAVLPNLDPLAPGTVWAEIKTASGSEKYFSEKIQDLYDTKIIIRKIDGITSDMRISYNTRIFQIKAVSKTDEENWWLEIKCMEKVAV